MPSRSHEDATLTLAIEGMCVKETQHAILVTVYDTLCWVPKSVIDAGSQVKRFGDTGSITVKHWFAYKSGWL